MAIRTDASVFSKPPFFCNSFPFFFDFIFSDIEKINLTRLVKKYTIENTDLYTIEKIEKVYTYIYIYTNTHPQAFKHVYRITIGY